MSNSNGPLLSPARAQVPNAHAAYETSTQGEGSPFGEAEVIPTSLRLGAVVPLAAGATLLLLIAMANLVKTEFTPQDKIAASTFDINPVSEDLPPIIDITPPDPLEKVEVPPPPPREEFVKVAEVSVPDYTRGDDVPDLSLDDIEFDLGLGTVVPVDDNGGPIVRVPPVFPARFMQGNHSGYCKVRFDISAQGKPFNVDTVMCTNSQLRGPTIKSVQKWNYKPAVRNGVGVTRSGVETKIRFDLADERGQRLALPSGY